jgi:hypothetical protein
VRRRARNKRGKIKRCETEARSAERERRESESRKDSDAIGPRGGESFWREHRTHTETHRSLTFQTCFKGRGTAELARYAIRCAIADPRGIEERNASRLSTCSPPAHNHYQTYAHLEVSTSKKRNRQRKKRMKMYWRLQVMQVMRLKKRKWRKGNYNYNNL